MMTFRPQPLVGPPADWRFPTPTWSRLSNGIDVVVYSLPGQHVIAAQLVLPTPLNAEDRSIEGVGTICARTLDEGSRTHPGEEFAELLESEGAGFGVEVSLSGLQAVLDVPSTRLAPALELFAEALIEPALGGDDVNRHVQLRLAEIEQAAANSSHTANIAFRRAVYSPDSRASRMSAGEADTVASITPEAVREFHQDHFGPAGATLVLAGDFPADPVQLAQAHLGGWRGTEQPRVAVQDAAAGARHVMIVDRPGAVQADLRLGGFGIDRLDPRWADISVASYAMGGAFLSRLNAVLREERGYTYGVRMNFGPLRTGGSFAVQGSFRTDVLVDALVEGRQLIDVSEKPFTDVEVSDAVTYFSGVSPLRFTTADGVADQAALQALIGLPTDYIDQSIAALQRVTPESATEAYRSLVHPDELSLVVVGDAATLAEPLRAAGYDELQVVAPL
jgi:zinc protease